MKALPNAHVFEQVRALEQARGSSAQITLLKLWVWDVIHTQASADAALVRLDEALSGGALYTPDRLSWCQALGVDEFGVFAEIRLDTLKLNMRWIPPGTFIMGSEDSERGRVGREGPQHKVSLAEGFWLGETPCTQALWKSVIGTQPSRFKSKVERPVEQVSWHSCEQFFDALNTKIPNLSADFPTEAQWEFACRAGSEEARYGAAKHIAWYVSNSEQRTHPVALKAPNSFGLFDMLGNVNEWCADGLRTYERGSVTDPLCPVDSYGLRAVRGGAWNSPAKHVRAACRETLHLGSRTSQVGFRICAMPGHPRRRP